MTRTARGPSPRTSTRRSEALGCSDHRPMCSANQVARSTVASSTGEPCGSARNRSDSTIPRGACPPRARGRGPAGTPPAVARGEGDLDLAEQGRQRRAKLVGGVPGESPLPIVRSVQPDERLMESIQQVVEGPPHRVQFVAGARRRQPLPQVGRRHRGRGRRHPAHRPRARRHSHRPHDRAPPRRRPKHNSVNPSRASAASTGAGDRPTTRTRLGILHLVAGLVVRVPAPCAAGRRVAAVAPRDATRGPRRRPSRPPGSMARPPASSRRGSSRGRRWPTGPPGAPPSRTTQRTAPARARRPASSGDRPAPIRARPARCPPRPRACPGRCCSRSSSCPTR